MYEVMLDVNVFSVAVIGRIVRVIDCSLIIDVECGGSDKCFAECGIFDRCFTARNKEGE